MGERGGGFLKGDIGQLTVVFLRVFAYETQEHELVYAISKILYTMLIFLCPKTQFIFFNG